MAMFIGSLLVHELLVSCPAKFHSPALPNSTKGQLSCSFLFKGQCNLELESAIRCGRNIQNKVKSPCVRPTMKPRAM